MRPNLQVPAPSATLLRFLRSQSEGICFFSANPRGFTFDHAASRVSKSSSKTAPHRLPYNARCLSRSAPRSAVVEANLLNLDFLWPRAAISTARWNPVQRRQMTKYGPLRPDVQPIAQRSSDTRRGWLRSFWSQRQKTLNPLKSDDLPVGSSMEIGGEAPLFHLGRNISPKSANEAKLRCTEFDENGNVVLVNGEFKKSELIAKFGLLPRDLRKIDSSVLPHILVRPSAILVNLLHIRCLIKANRVLVFDVYGSTDSYTQSVFMYDLEHKLRQKQSLPSAGGLPYEFRALEAVLISVTSALEAEFEGVRDPVVRVLRELEEDIDRDKLRHLLIYSKKLGTFEQRATLVRDAIDELLDADDDLAAMYLTEKTHDIMRAEDDHTEVEMLLESYHKVGDEIVQASGNLVSNIRNTEEIVKAILDANRNALMLLDLKFSIGTLGIGSGAFVAALYGMNLKNFLEESELGFFGVSAWSFVFAAIVCTYGLTKLRKVQRVSMWGEAGKRGGRGSWRNTDEETAAGLLGAGRKDRAERSLRLKEERYHAMKEGLLTEEQRLPALVGKGKK